MTTISIPDNFYKFILERDNYRNLWIAWAIVEDYWYKGAGDTKETAFMQLEWRVQCGQHIAKLEPARYAPKEGKAYRKATIPPADLPDLDLSSFDIDL